MASSFCTLKMYIHCIDHKRKQNTAIGTLAETCQYSTTFSHFKEKINSRETKTFKCYYWLVFPRYLIQCVRKVVVHLGYGTYLVDLVVSIEVFNWYRDRQRTLNPLNPELNPICYLLALLGAHHFLHVNRIRIKLLTFRLLMSYIYGAPILDVSRSHTTTQHSR